MCRAELVLGALLALGMAACKKDPPPPAAPEIVTPKLTSVGPRLISNATKYGLYLHGEGFGDKVELELRVQELRLRARRITDHLAFVQIDHIEVPPAKAVATLEATLFADKKRAGSAPLLVVNDANYPHPYDIEVIDGHVFVASPTTDTVFELHADRAPTAVAAGDQPRALAEYREGGKSWLVIVHELDNRIFLLDANAATDPPRVLQARAGAQSIELDGSIAYLSSRTRDSVHVFDLATDTQQGRWYVGQNPRSLAVGAGRVAVSNVTGDEMVLLDPSSGTIAEVVVGPGAKIIGGHTAPFSDSVMGLKAPRDLKWSPKHQVFIAATLGPNIGPNAARMEVSLNSGLSVISADGTYKHHVSMRRGIVERIALDEERGVVLATDISRGRVVAFDLAAVVAGQPPVVLAQAFIEPPADTKLLRPRAQYGEKNRATISMYSGPSAIDLDGGFAWVLNRFTGTVSKLDYAEVKSGKLTVTETWGPIDLGPQTQRRAGEVVFSTDFGDTRMSCEGCHYEGHNQGTLFTKGNPMHIYRVTSLRSISETPPYFTPAKFPSLAKISHFVTARNRFQNLPPNTDEVAALAAFQRTLAPPPNPYIGANPVSLPNGMDGEPARGAVLFEQNCSGCHPPPMFTPDQDPKTRGQTFPTGEVTTDLRREQQDATPYPVPVPTLVGVWDNHPLFHGGQVGNEVRDGRLVPTRFALGDVLDQSNHFDASKLDKQERNDLLAYVLTL